MRLLPVARRWLGSIISKDIPDLVPTSTMRSGMWDMNELYDIDQFPTLSLTATTHSTVDGASYSFTGQSFGEAHPRRQIMAIVTGQVTTGTTTMTIGGITASRMVTATGGPQGMVEMWTAHVPSTSTSGTIALTMSATNTRCHLAVLRYIGPDRSPAITFSTAAVLTTTATTSQTIPMTIPRNAFSVQAFFTTSLITYGFTGGTTQVLFSTAGAEAARLAVGITDATSAARAGHNVTSTLTSGSSARATFGIVFR